MVRLLVAFAVLGLFAVACGGGGDETPTPGGSPTATAVGTATPSGTEPANGLAFDLKDVTITLDDLPEGWQEGAASVPDSLSGFDHSYFTNMQREDGASVRVTLISGTPESVAALRLDVEAVRQQAVSAEVTPLDELIPTARKSVADLPGYVDEAITFIVGPVLTTVWVTFPVDSDVEPTAEDVAELVYDRILEQTQ
jgi:hypothetical protein